MRLTRSLFGKFQSSNQGQPSTIPQTPPLDVFSFAGAIQRGTAQELADLQSFLQAVLRVLELGITPRSQLLQECFALSQNPQGPDIFIECGAGRSEFLSNTYVLQKSFDWQGLLIEPNPEFQEELERERVTASVHLAPNACGSDGEIDLVCVGELSTSTQYLRSDGHSQERVDALNAGMVTTVRKIPLGHLLEQFFGTPRRLGFLSVDVEGAEMDVLQSLDWSRWSFNAISVEHNNRSEFHRDLNTFMKNCGYRNFLNGSTQWDAWYVPDSHS
jgi:FkbM family methyltransferase